MKVITPARQLPISASALTIGTFDGVHKGHRHLLSRAIEFGASMGIPSVAVTFHPHPASIVRAESVPKLINSFEERLSLFEEAGVDFCYLVEFDQARANESAEDFVRSTLVEELGAKAVVVGPDFRFGHRRGGDVELLRVLGASLGFVVEADPFVMADAKQAARVRKALGREDEVDEVVISSTLIRSLIARGEVELGNELLGRDFFITGLVNSGDGRGGVELGFPTANVAYSPSRLLPADGVYAGWVRFGLTKAAAAISVGTRPTYYPQGGDRLIEAFVLDFAGDLYGREISVGFQRFLRVQEAFSTSSELLEQIERDVETVRRQWR